MASISLACPLSDPIAVNPLLQKLQPYPFEKLRLLFRDVVPPATLKPISFGIGEPKHPTPPFILEGYQNALGGLAVYPATAGSDALRQAAADWLKKRYPAIAAKPVDAATQILPVAGTREALFSIAQTVIDPSAGDAIVVCPNPFYQIYEGAALLAGATPYYVNAVPARNFAPDYDSIPDTVWAKTQLVYVCSPGNPTGATLDLEGWKALFALSDKHGFVIASDECYSEIYFGDTPPLGALEAARLLGRGDDRLLAFTSLSKRSNVPGLRSGFVAGDATLMRAYLLYRTYHGSALSPTVQQVSIAAWSDESHVEENRAAYRRKFDIVTPMLAEVLDVALPDASFYLWANVARTGLSDIEFARELYARQHVTVLPGSFLARESQGVNPGAGYVRLALVAGVEECIEGARRIVAFCASCTAPAAPTR
ncbi:succinyldiaminopimelate transaminase [Robbsia andropogonis]|nr:succinyldiaminopimelate transaminase [Robbsia andropogonis]MCP1117632.1 succinyldiaminopimelate transaminase [Robbsia andropogonis]MCP1127098.1 succinyldiaminopimelate transaminase [Robbsia andropogonis]